MPTTKAVSSTANYPSIPMISMQIANASYGRVNRIQKKAVLWIFQEVIVFSKASSLTSAKYRRFISLIRFRSLLPTRDATISSNALHCVCSPHSKSFVLNLKGV